MLVAVIDNYDSFTFNLVHYILHTGVEVKVFRNDRISIDDLNSLNLGAIVISPGPGRPEDAGISLDLIKHFSGRIPLLGVCLGHQVIAQSFGGKIIQARQIMHGKTSVITSDGEHIFSGINKAFTVMRYHSLAVSKEDFPDCLTITAKTYDGEIMGIRHKEHQTHGVQFHPESFMTTLGKRLIENFIKGA
ncbi:MAG: aminodeoxychorismate/anthranilate synthase component II [Desulfobacula sp.]|uniref:anthranilate synthase component II n=1 Tax=Desulfobacula sp. TaxID=2593537 RepID=UPI0025B8A8B7|nr:aminodeoxychorismate/anthranilate synthase component II [Desulfobacula sp.]MCD4722656.1 aminodeoxychorismate/anthranilate synthase component II [Desulfobacula sp.]